MKPRIFINMHYMELGGAERALLGLLNALDTERVDVDLFLNQHTGEFMPLIPKKINLLPERRGYNAIEQYMAIILMKGQLQIVKARLHARKQHQDYYMSLDDEDRKCDSSWFHFVADSVQPLLPPLNDLGEYDLAISFLPPHNIVLNKVNAKKKIAWIHTDYSAVHVNAELELPIWNGFNYIVSISPDCTRSFLKVFPSLKSKIIEIENILSPEFVRHQAEMFDASKKFSRQSIKLLSIGRYHHAKNYDNVPDIARRIVAAGYDDLRWYIIGYGLNENKREIKRKIAQAGMQKHVILLGKKKNPYPYIKACDLYVQPSRYEGKSMTVREAQILTKPVIVTNYTTAKSQINNEIDGVIVPMDNEGCAQGIIDMIQNVALQESIVNYLSSHDYGNESEVEKLYALI